jgi:hypothetical protein
MLLLVSTSDKIRVSTSSTSAIDVHASYVDLSGTTVTPGRRNTAISSATTTDVVLSPPASTSRNVKTLTIRNTGASNNDVAIIHTDGTTSIEVYRATLGPNASLFYTEESGFFIESSVVSSPPSWGSKVLGCCIADPGMQMLHMQRGSNVAATPTNIGTTVARCSLFIPPVAITANRLRWYGVGAVTSIYTVALYRYSDLARLSSAFTITTAANAWGSVDLGGIALSAGVPYFVACSANTTGTTAGIGCIGTTVAATTGQVAIAPGSLPGNLGVGNNYLGAYWFQFAVTAGALPNPAAALAAQAAWTGGMPAFWVDNATTA